ncbi:adenosylmethionine--8-amino-7-oxononanoate transaminase [Desulforhopalus singaporensis]|uniref:Adenosylmethionine-8-amino-7-oxononanoate aminotransferase n=1 Tax=Desulforhopalus singaporensis TaxID=91360 RepID=A0A1H0VEB9_9BACT|nr:adenosylmethionine--8-amino-7-oxononanoate transaminase [Desulforhopalus singaporensis]SDP76683.1 adenosylmethionine-8-amino-7-oxononanoate aminotransferase [Desulforhopalus singaporensis]
MDTTYSVKTSSLLDFDRKHLWHPYTSITNPLPVYPVESAEGVRIRLANGKELIDGMASWWAAIHGYNHPVLVDAIREQAARLPHIMFGGLTHGPAVNLARLLVECSPEPLEKVFLADSGSVAVEVAMKMAVQYQRARGFKEKNRFLSLRSGYHGDTFHAMSVCDPVTGMHGMYKNILPEYYFAEAPHCCFGGEWDPGDLASITRILQDRHSRICAVILEPVIQGAGGMRFYHPEYLRQVRSLCDQFEVLLIADEIATGFGRSGKLFGCNHAGISPDIMCLGKALTGGCMTLAAVLATAQVESVISSAAPGIFMHGPTFMGNPLACKTAEASIKLLFSSDWQTAVANIESQLIKGLFPLRPMKHVRDVRVLGATGVVELTSPVDMAAVQREFVARGVWVRPFGKLVYVMPPYIIDNNDLRTLTQAICQVVERIKTL